MSEEETHQNLDKLSIKDVNLNNKKPQPVKKIKKFATVMNNGSSVRKSLNITEEALAIGKIPCEEVARMIARGGTSSFTKASPRTKEMVMLSRGIKDCFS